MEWGLLMAITDGHDFEHFTAKDDSAENSDEEPGQNFV